MRSVAILLGLSLLGVLVACGGGNSFPATSFAAGDAHPPRVSGVAPSAGSAAGGRQITIRGRWFHVAGDIEVTIGGYPATSIVVADIDCADHPDEELTCVTPPGSAGTTVDVVVTTPAGSGVLPGGFSYLPALTLSSVAPRLGWNAGRTEVAIAGSGFAGGEGCSVSFGSAEAVVATVVDDTTLTVTLPMSVQRGPVDVLVRNDQGEELAPAAFTYVNYPPILDPLGDVEIDDDSALAWGESPEVAAAGDRIYVAWLEDRDGTGYDVCFNRSLDAGETWGATTLRLNAETGSPGIRLGLRMCADGDNVYVTWVDGRNDGTPEVYFNRSKDGGATWLAHDTRVFHTAPGSVPLGLWHSVACDGDRVVVVWPDDRSGTGKLFANASSDGGDTWLAEDVVVGAPGSGIAPCSALCMEGTAVYLVWRDPRNGSDDVFFNRSADGGATWVASEIRLDRGPAASSAYDPAIACSGPNVYVAWPDDRGGTGPADIYLVASTDGGLTFGDEHRVNAGGEAPGCVVVDPGRPSLRMTCDGAAVRVCWLDCGTGETRPLLNRSFDAGQTFGPSDIRLNPAADEATTHVSALAMCSDGDVVHVAILQSVGGAGEALFLNSSADGGATFLDEEVRVSADAALGHVEFRAGLACNGPIAYHAWRDDRRDPDSGRGDVFFRRNVP